MLSSSTDFSRWAIVVNSRQSLAGRHAGQDATALAEPAWAGPANRAAPAARMTADAHLTDLIISDPRG